MLCLGMVSTNLFRLSYAGEIQNLNCRAGNGNVPRSIIFLHVGEICKRRQSCCSTVPRTGSTDTNVCGGFAVVHALSVDEHKHSPARIRYSNKVLYTVRESRIFVETSKSRPTHARLRNRELADEAELVSLSVG